MVYLVILTLVAFLLAFGIKLLISCLLIKFFNKTAGFFTTLKPILLYEFGVFCFFFVDPTALLYLFKAVIPYRFLLLTDLLIIVAASFFIFNFVMQKFLLFNLKKTLIIFFIMFLVLTPVISYGTTMIEKYIVSKFSIFSYGQPTPASLLQIFYQQQPRTLSQMLLDKIDGLSDVFLEGRFLSGLFQFIVTFSI